MSFADALARTLTFEGGFSQHPLDPGGRTNYGITQKTYDNWRAVAKLPKRDVALIEDHELQVIYRENYWDACNCDALPDALAAAVFDMAVNSGPWNAKLTLQKALLVRADGVIGPWTILAAKKMPDAVLRFLKARAGFIQEIVQEKPSQSVFLHGWINRLLEQAWKGGT